jgi:hypothetical protein
MQSEYNIPIHKQEAEFYGAVQVSVNKWTADCACVCVCF